MADILPARTILTDQVSTKLWADPLADRDLAQPFFGPAVFTGSCDEAGTTLGLTVAQLAEVLRQAEWLREYTADTLAEIAAIGQGIAARIR